MAQWAARSGEGVFGEAEVVPPQQQQQQLSEPGTVTTPR
jgi:hypothetical protein